MSYNHWNIPNSVEELFANGNAQYSITAPEFPGDNNYRMTLFIDCVDDLFTYVVEDYGTQVIVHKDGVTLQIDSGGLGDFHLHGFDVKILEDD